MILLDFLLKIWNTAINSSFLRVVRYRPEQGVDGRHRERQPASLVLEVVQGVMPLELLP